MMLAHGLVRLERAGCSKALLSQLDDNSVAGETLVALGKTKDPSVLDAVRGYVEHPDSWIRGKAKSAFKKLAKLTE